MAPTGNVLVWSKTSFGFFCHILWKNPNKIFCQRNTFPGTNSFDLHHPAISSAITPTEARNVKCRGVTREICSRSHRGTNINNKFSGPMKRAGCCPASGSGDEI